jgi:hypothetical protein
MPRSVIYEQPIDILALSVAGAAIDDQRSQPSPRHHRPPRNGEFRSPDGNGVAVPHDELKRFAFRMSHISQFDS